MKIINLILSCNGYPWKDSEQAILDTYYKDRGDIDVFFYYGGSETNFHTDRDIHVTQEEGFYNIGKKTLEVFDYVYNNFEFDLIYRTNTSSYIDYDLFKKEISKHQIENLYAGHIGETHNGTKFASGAGYVLSKNLVKEVIDNKDSLDHRLIDDVSLGKFFSSKKITSLPRFDVKENEEIDPNYFHYRCKAREYSDYIKFTADSFKTIYEMKHRIEHD